MGTGLGMEGIAKLVMEYFDGCEKFRALMIARTETIRASNAGASMAYLQSGVVEGMQWLVTEDDRTCPLCNAMSGKFVPLGQTFFNLGDRFTVDTPEGKQTMVFDYEDVRYPPLHVMCRCTVVPVVAQQYQLPEKAYGLSSLFIYKHQAGPTHDQLSHGRWAHGGQLPSSKAKYTDPKTGEYTEERLKEHRRIIDEYLEAAKRSENPEVMVLGGGTASGKSTMNKIGFVQYPEGAITVNNDEIKFKLADYQDKHAAGDFSAAAYVNDEAGDITIKVLKALNEMKASYIYDTTGSKVKKMDDMISDLHARGYKVSAVYATVPVKQAIFRMEERASRVGSEDYGRFVPRSVVRAIHRDVSKSFQAIAPKYDKVELYDTSGDYYGKGEKPIKILSYTAGDERPKIYDMARYEKFIDKGRSRRDKRVITWKYLQRMLSKCWWQ
jgi:predicted ABC-type ATPase